MSVCVPIYGYERVIMGWLNIYIFIHFQFLSIYYPIILSHSPSCIMISGSCDRWGLGQVYSLVMPCQTWDSPARQVVLKTCMVHRKGSVPVIGQQPKTGKTLRWAGSFQFPRNFHQTQGRGTFLKIKMKSRLPWGHKAFSGAFIKVA